MYPELGYTVVVLSNIDDEPDSIAFKLREWLTQGLSRQMLQPMVPPGSH